MTSYRTAYFNRLREDKWFWCALIVFAILLVNFVYGQIQQQKNLSLLPKIAECQILARQAIMLESAILTDYVKKHGADIFPSLETKLQRVAKSLIFTPREPQNPPEYIDGLGITPEALSLIVGFQFEDAQLQTPSESLHSTLALEAASTKHKLGKSWPCTKGQPVPPEAQYCSDLTANYRASYRSRRSNIEGENQSNRITSIQIDGQSVPRSKRAAAQDFLKKRGKKYGDLGAELANTYRDAELCEQALSDT